MQAFFHTPVLDPFVSDMATVAAQVFKLLSIAAGRPGTPQCFMLTPKLLNNLPYSPEVKVLSIVNGPHLQRVGMPFNKVGMGCRVVPLLSERPSC